jgi:hypothetical protein
MTPGPNTQVRIPKEAVIAAAKVLIREQTHGCYAYRPEGHPGRDDLDRYADDHARKALEAAAPFLEVAPKETHFGCPDCGERDGCQCRWKGVL